MEKLAAVACRKDRSGRMTELDKAIEVLKEKYKEAVEDEYVATPLVYALHHTWMEFDIYNRWNKGSENDDS